MDKKKTARIVMVLPVVVALVVVGVILFFVLSAGGNGQDSATSPQMADASAAIEGTNAAGHDEAGPSCAFDFLIGQHSREATAQIASLSRPIRVLGPDSMATQDYSAERINLMIDENGMVQSVNCQ